MSDTKLPSGIELTPLNDAFKQNPYEALATLRENAPVYVDTDLKRYIYTRHDDVKAILRDRDYWSDPRKANPGTFTYEILGGSLNAQKSHQCS